MRAKRRQSGALFLLLTILTTSACSAPNRALDLGGFYNSRKTSGLISPIGWKQELFLFSDNRNLTNDPAFTDNLPYIL